MQKALFLIPLILAFLLAADTGLAIGISPSDLKINFTAGTLITDNFVVWNSNSETTKIILSKSGELTDVVSIPTDVYEFEPEERKTFEFALILPEELTPGTHLLKIGAVEVPPEGSGLSAMTAVDMLVYVIVPYPPKYIKTDINVSPESEAYNVTLSALNLGNESTVASGTMVIRDCWNITIKNISINSTIVTPGEVEQFYEMLPSISLKNGLYTAQATLFYESGTAETEKEFMVGIPELNISRIKIDMLKQGSTREMSVDVSNLYAGNINNVYVDARIWNQSWNSSTVNMTPMENRTFTVSVDADNLKYGVYQSDITLSYEGGSVTRHLKVYVLPKNIEYIVVGLCVGILLVIGTAMYLVRKKK